MDPGSTSSAPEPGQAPDPHAAAEVHIEITASGAAVVNSAVRDLHQHYWDGVRERRRAESGRDPVDICPYPGLAAFEPDQARWFHGRDALLGELLTRLDARLRGGGMQLVVAPSGAGKSSLLRAGLLPKLARSALPGARNWPQVTMTPTGDPLGALAERIMPVGTGPADLAATAERLATAPRSTLAAAFPAADGDGRMVLVVDQFEELFTLCPDTRGRQAFVDVLARLSDAGTGAADIGPSALVVLGLRADFYAACVDHPQLRAAMQDRPLIVGPMSEAELRAAILFPARDVGLSVEPGLTQLLLRELGAMTEVDQTPGGDDDQAPSGGYEASRLPLLAHALRMCWQQRDGSTLTVAGYERVGGIRQAVATTAEAIFSSLDEAGRRTAEQIFLRLVKIGDGTEDTRRQASRDELLLTGSEPSRVAAVLDAFTQARLLTQNRKTVEITHEALLNSWPRLRGWISADRVGRLAHQSFEEYASAWHRSGRDSSALRAGDQLKAALTWAEGAAPDRLSRLGRDFLSAAKKDQRRRLRSRTSLAAVFAVLALVASISAAVAFQQRG